MDDDGAPAPPEKPDDTAASIDASIEAIEIFAADTEELRLRWGPPSEDDLQWLALEIVEPMSGDATGWTARQWWDAFGDALVREAMASGARDFDVRFHIWGLVFETGYRDEGEIVSFRERPGVRAALDQLGQLGFAYSFGRRGGGGAGARRGRPLAPLAGAGAVALPLPEEAPVP